MTFNFRAQVMPIPDNPDAHPTRIGIVGLGKMGLLHAAILNSLPGSSVAAIAEPADLPRNSFARMNGSIRMFPSAERMFAECELDAAVIATPVAGHVPVALLCVQRGIPFLLEKPLAPSAPQALALLEALRRKPLMHAVGYMARFADSFAKARQILLSDCLGSLQRVTGTTYVSQLFTRGKGWRYDRKLSGGGVLLSQGTHVLDLLTWLVGPVVRVNADVQSFYSPQIEDFAHVMLEFRSGLRGWVDSSWSVRGRRKLETSIELAGDNGTLAVTDDAVRLSLDKARAGYPAGSTVWRAAELFQPVPIDIGGPEYTREDEAFLRAVQIGAGDLPDAPHAYHIQQIVDAAYASAEASGRPERIAP